MLRWFQVILCICVLFVVSGCNEEVKEISAKDEDGTPKVSEAEKQKLLDAENKRGEKAKKAREEQTKKTGTTKKTS